MLVCFVLLCLFSRWGWPVGKTHTERKSGLRSGSATAILPDQCHGTCCVPLSQQLHEGSSTFTGVGAAWTYGLTICQHPLKVEGNFKWDNNDFAWSSLGQSSREEGGRGAVDCSAREATNPCFAFVCCFCECFGKGNVWSQPWAKGPANAFGSIAKYLNLRAQYTSSTPELKPFTRKVYLISTILQADKVRQRMKKAKRLCFFPKPLPDALDKWDPCSCSGFLPWT